MGDGRWIMAATKKFDPSKSLGIGESSMLDPLDTIEWSVSRAAELLQKSLRLYWPTEKLETDAPEAMIHFHVCHSLRCAGCLIYGELPISRPKNGKGRFDGLAMGRAGKWMAAIETKNLSGVGDARSLGDQYKDLETLVLPSHGGWGPLPKEFDCYACLVAVCWKEWRAGSKRSHWGSRVVDWWESDAKKEFPTPSKNKPTKLQTALQNSSRKGKYCFYKADGNEGYLLYSIQKMKKDHWREEDNSPT